MKKILVICGAGVATSTVAINKIKNLLDEHQLAEQVVIDQGSVAELPMRKDDYDLIVSTANIDESSIDTPVVMGLPFLTGIGVEDTVNEIIRKLGF